MFSVGASQDSVAEPVAAAEAGSICTVNGPIDAVLLPSVAVMVMAPVVPTSALVGVPESTPVLALKVAHAGCPVIEKLTVPPLADTVGLNA